jgi:hypothetical protein
MSATTDAILDNCRAKLNGAADGLIKLELYNAVDELCREALREPAPVGVDATPDTWLASEALFVENYQVLLHGTLYRMYVQLGKPWSQPELGKVHLDLYTQYLDLARTEAAAGTTTAYARLLAAVRVLFPFVRDAGIDLELFGVVNQVRLDALGLDELDGTDSDVSTWLTIPQYGECYQALYQGLLSRLYSQTGKPWANAEQAQLHAAKFLAEIDQLRAEQADTPATAYARLVAAVKVALPFVRDEAVKLELFGVVNQVRLDALGLDELDGTNPDVTTWLTAAQYGEAYQVLYAGVLARLYSQVTKPWANPDQAQAQSAAYFMALDQLRTEQADAPTTAYARIVAAIKVQLPFARDEAIKLEIFNTINKIRTEAYMIDALTGTETTTTSWLTTTQYGDAYNAILHGALARLYSQPSKPWADAAAYEIHNNQYTAELDLLRGTSHAVQASSLERLMNDLRVRLPGARDEVTKQELFAAADELFKLAGVWREEIIFPVNTEDTLYELESEESYARIHRLLKVVNADDIPVYAVMKLPSEVTFSVEPSAEVDYTAHVMLTLDEHVDSDGYPHIPTWVMEQYRETLLDGVLGRMMSQIAKPYTNERMSTYHLRRFRNAIAQARTDAARTYLHGAQNWQFPRGWR